MKETIYTIPINEAFDRKHGCPICKLIGDLEKSSLEYVMGAAMMEPDVRIETNRLGFCSKHLNAMFEMNNRLGLALILESHLGELCDKLYELPDRPNADKTAKSFDELKNSCFVCSRIETQAQKMLNNIVYLWQSSTEFREKMREQPFYCPTHLAMLAATAKSELNRKDASAFIYSTTSVTRNYVDAIRYEVSGFVKSFDHRNAGVALDERTKTSVERAVSFLNGKYIPDEK